MAIQDGYIKTALRLPRDLHTEIQATAEQSGRSMNAEIIHRLQSSRELAIDTAFPLTKLDGDSVRVVLHVDISGDQDLKASKAKFVMQGLHDLYDQDSLVKLAVTIRISGEQLVHLDERYEALPVVLEITPEL